MAGVRQFDEEAALQAALDIFWRQGFAGTTMPDLAQATGVQRGSLYNAYGDKETIFHRAFDLYTERVLDSAEACLKGDDAAKMLNKFFEIAIASMFGGAPARGCLVTKTASDGSVANLAIRRRLRGLLDALAALLGEALSKPGIRRQLALEPTEASLLIVTFIHGLAVMERVYGKRKALLQTAQTLTRVIVAKTRRRS